MADENENGAGGGAADPVEALRQAGRKAVEGGTTVSTVLIDQAESNAREAFSAMRAAAAAKDPAELMKIQGDFLREQSNRAMAQARELGDLIVRFGKDAASSMKPGGEG